MAFLIGESVKKQFRGYALFSEEIFKKMGVKDLNAMEKVGVEAYIDENNRMYDDVYKYTQFLDYDPLPLVDIEEQKIIKVIKGAVKNLNYYECAD